MNNLIKPKLVFFQWEHEKIPSFLRLHLQQHVKCLSESFDVVVINEDCDYQQICDQYQPDLVLFESTVYGGKRDIRNTSAHPSIPKLGFLHADAYCMSREALISDMENWGIETFFSLSVSMAEYTPAIADRLFIWPNFVDTNLYRDYGESKNIPVLFTGSQAAHYPWRNQISKIISQCYPSLICPHFGWSDTGATSRMISGERYARMLNASWIVPTCGTIAKDLVRKHLEIPAARSCLVTERTPVLEAAGFTDMQNCIFADKHDVLDKLDYVFQHPDELERIINAGYQLVHSQHTLKQRDQIFQWFSLYKTLKPNQRIVQTSPFEPLVVVEKSSGIQNSHIVGSGVDRVLLSKGDEKLWAGQYDEAKALYLKCLNYHPYMPEPKLRSALCHLYEGNAESATSWILQPIKATLETYEALEPDPVEWAYLVICRLCQGKLDDAVKCAYQFPSLYHPELDRVRWAICVLSNKTHQTVLLSTERSQCRYSLHQLPNRSFNEWVETICMMLKRCQQIHLAERLRGAVSSNHSSLLKQSDDISRKFQEYGYKNWLSNSIVIFKNMLNSKSITNLDLIQETNYTRLAKFLKPKLKQYVLKPLNHLEARFGYFLPYRFSEMKNDEFFGTIQKLIREEDIKTALVIEACFGGGSTEAFLTGIRENPNKPTTFYLNTETSEFDKFQKQYDNDAAKFYQIPSVTSKRLLDEFKNSIQKMKQENAIDSFDVILITGLGLDISDALSEEFCGARFILLDNINTLQNQKNHQRLLTDDHYILDMQNPDLRGGYAIFRNVNQRRIFMVESPVLK
jgi:tetratricopeptide (TPR) repeat protein